MEILRRLTNTMDHLLLLIFSLFVFFFLTSPKCYEMEDRNSPGLDLCSWLYHYFSTVRSHSSALRCGWLASRRLAATGCLAHNDGYKMPPFYYIGRSTIQLTLKITSSPPSETCNGSSTNIWINRSTVTSTKPFSQKRRCGWVNGSQVYRTYKQK